jgi:hypothetical protein
LLGSVDQELNEQRDLLDTPGDKLGSLPADRSKQPA